MIKYTDEDIAELVNTMRRAPRRFDFLTGAGMSLSAGIPLAGDLVKEIIRTHVARVSRQPEALRNDYGACMNLLSLDERNDLLAPYLRNSKINWAHIALACLMKAEHVRRVLTFNFDNILARACGLLGLYPATYDFGIAPAERVDFLSDPSIIHLHGQGVGPVMMNSTEETQKHADKLRPLIDDCLGSSNLVVIGYSGQADRVFPMVARCYSGRRHIYWVGRSDRPGEHLKDLFEGDHKAYCHYIGGADADSFMIKLAQELDCFPPEVFKSPADHLLSEMKDVISFPMGSTGMTKDILVDTRSRLGTARSTLEMSINVASVLGNNPAGIIDIEKPLDENGTSHEPIDQEIQAWAHFSTAYDLQTEAKASLDLDKLEKLEKSAGEYAKAVQVKPDFYQALNNWGNRIGDLAKLKSDEILYSQAFDKYEKALSIKTNYYEALFNWGAALGDLAKLNGDETTYRKAFEKYEKAFSIKSDDHELFFTWGNTLGNLAELKSDEAIYRQAFEKYKKALSIKADGHEFLFNWGNALSDLAKLKSDEALYRQAFEKYEKALAIKDDDHELLCAWGNALGDLAELKSDEALYRQAFEKYEKALSFKTDYYEALFNWGTTLGDLAKLKSDESLYRQAFGKYEKALSIKPDHYESLFNWANTLGNLAKMKKDEELYKKAFEKYESAIVINKDDHKILDNYASALLGAWHLSGNRHYLSIAESVLDRVEAIVPEDCYNRACLAAILGDEEGVRQRLEKALAHATLPAGEHLMTDDDLEPFRDMEWFKSIVERAKSRR
ncbi:TPR end-of-group domain-containing protein [Pararhizobium sp.]|uniref:TPR end-of-group domain-containing protein n=1 Tax=Pararhizobium sp. TaxID=1977563 RepID=UPI003D123EB4